MATILNNEAQKGRSQASRELIVKTNEIPPQGLTYHFTSQSAELNTHLEDIMGPFPEYKAQLDVKTSESVTYIKTNISGQLDLVCSRCAEATNLPFTKKTLIAYQRSDGKVVPMMDNLDDLDTSFEVEFLEGNEINLAEVVHEQIALEIPFQPLCQEDCQGLCSQCGNNLNRTKCQCPSVAEKYSPFAKLKNLKGDS